MNPRFFPALACVIAAGTAILAWGTDGFSAATSEGARRLRIERMAPQVPDVGLVDQDGHTFSFRDLRGRVVMVEFIYTGCATLCTALGDGFQRVQSLLARQGGDDIAMLSISFDRAGDGPEQLKLYGRRYDAVPSRWRVAVPADTAGLRALLRTFGVVVIPDRYGGFVHNGGLYLVDTRGRLVRLLDPAAPERSVAQAVALARP